MNNDFEKKTAELIELANETTEEAVEAVEEKKLPISVPDVPAKKKKGKAGKVILAIVLVIVALLAALVGTGCGLVSCVTADELPEATPAATQEDLKAFVGTAAAEMIKENTISVDSSIINFVLNTIKDSVNKSAPADMFSVEDLFSEIKDGKGTIYARAYINTIDIKGFKLKIDKTVPVKADFKIGFNNETKDIIIEIGEVKCGKIVIPREVILIALAAVELPEEVKVDENGNLLYNTAGLDAMLDEAVAGAITSGAEDITSGMDGFFGDLLSDLINGAANAAANAANKLVNVELNDANIVEDKIVIEGEVF